MKYKKGDRVRIKTWEKMEKEFGPNKRDLYSKKYGFFFLKIMERTLNERFPDRVVEIEGINQSFSPYYSMKNIEWEWVDEMIKCLVIDPKERIYSRFDILDFGEEE